MANKTALVGTNRVNSSGDPAVQNWNTGDTLTDPDGNVIQTGANAPSPSDATPQQVGTGTGQPGTSNDYSRADHVHQTNAQPGTATPQDVGLTGVVGTATAYAREDHVHGGAVVGTAGYLEQAATAAVATYTVNNYSVGADNLLVFVNGAYVPKDQYTEDNPTQITFTTYPGLPFVGSEKIVTFVPKGGLGLTNQLWEKQVAGASQAVFNLAGSYDVGTHSLLVFVDGTLNLVGASEDYQETGTQQVTFNTPLSGGEEVLFLVPRGSTTENSGAYSAGTPGDWNGAPTTIGDALDRLAAELSRLIGYPIP